MDLATQTIARRLISLEALCDSNPGEERCEAVRVCEKLRVPLTKFLGLDGYRSLMARALTMAKADCPSLQSVKIQGNGSFHGIDIKDAEAAVVILTKFLALLVTFVGERMTLRLVIDEWPNACQDETDSSVKEQS